MAIIEKIRSQRWLVIVLVGASLILFSLQGILDLFSRASGGNIGVIDGHSIDAKEWMNAVEVQSKLFRYDGNQTNLSNDTWNNLMERILMSDEYEELGIQVTDEEFEQVTFGEILSPYVKSTLYANNDSASAKEQMRKNFDGMDDQMAGGWRQLIKQKRQREKYDLLIRKGVYANSVDGKWAFKKQNDKVAVDYVVKTYAEIPDSAVTWTEGDIRSYYNKHKNDKEYKQETSRSVEYIRFPVTPSALDSSDIRTSLGQLVAGFETAASDSGFAAMNAENPANARVAYAENSIPEPWNTQILTDTVGDVIGPFVDGASMKLVKISKRGLEVDSVAARHILFKEKAEAAKAKADSVRKVILRDKNFAEMAAKFGTDGTKDKGGDLGTFARGMMVKPFEDACFNGKVGDIQIVETSFGVHIVEVTKKNAPKMVTYVSIIDKPLRASASTVKSAYNEVNDFTINFNDSASFRNAADTLRGGVPITPAKNIRPNATTVSGLTDAYDVVSWAYKAEVGEVSPPIKVGDEWVVVLLTEIRERGVPTLENVYDQMKARVIEEKKAEKYMELMKSGTLQEIATAVGSTVKQGINISLSSNNIPGSGVNATENEVIGVCFGLPRGNISTPIKGKGGVYVIQRNADALETPSQDNYVTDRDNVIKGIQGRAAMTLYNSFKESADIEDNRYE